MQYIVGSTFTLSFKISKCKCGSSHISNDAEFPISDFGAYNIYPKLTVVATLVSDDEMDVVVTTNASDVHWPLEYTIKIEPEASISFVEGFLNGTDEGSIGDDTKDPDTEVEGGTGEAQ